MNELIGNLTIKQVKQIALSKGFKLKPQENGEQDLNDYVYQFAKAIIEEHEQNKWVYVYDKLPPDNRKVLVYYWGARRLDIGYFDRGGFYKNGKNNSMPTYWQFLPNPPITRKQMAILSISHDNC